MKFVRYGGANSQDNEFCIKNSQDFNKPPVRRGIYAFPFGKTARHLIEWKYGNDNSTRNEIRALLARDRRDIEYHGNVWHHLDPSAESMGTVGSWTLDRIDVYEKKLRRHIGLTKSITLRDGTRFSNSILEVFLPGKV